jgi:hypothetical protein
MEHELDIDPLNPPDIEDGLGSIQDRLAKRREAVAQNKVHDIDIPGYDGELFCRYRLLSGDEVQSITVKVSKQSGDRSEKMLAIVCDNLIAACQEFWVRDNGNGKEIPVRGFLDLEEPVRYDMNLAKFLQFNDELPEPATARAVVLALFGGNDLAIDGHGSRLMRWMMGNNVELDNQLGEVMDLLR